MSNVPEEDPQEDLDFVESSRKASKPSTSEKVAAIFNGLGVGILLGLLLGLAVSPVVSGIIGTLSSLLAVLLGLNEKFLSPIKSFRVGAFGFSSVVGILLGMYIRTHNLLSPDLHVLKQQYLELGYTDEEALDFISFQEFGLVPDHWSFGGASVVEETVINEEPKTETIDSLKQEIINDKEVSANDTQTKKTTSRVVPTNLPQTRRASVLYASELNTADCYMLAYVDESTAVSEMISAFEVVGGSWKTLAKNLEKELKSDALKTSLLICKESFCGDKSNGKLKIANCDELAKETSATSRAQSFEENGEPWLTLTASARKQLSKEDFVKLILTISNTFCK